MRKVNLICVGILMIGMLFSGCGYEKVQENTQVGYEKIENHEFDNALAAFDVAHEKKENPRMIARGRGIASIGLTDYKSAVSYFKEALSYSDVWVDALDYDLNYYMALSYEKMGDYKNTIDTYSSIIALSPKDGLAYCNRGSAYLLLGEHDSAIKDFDKALSLDKDNYDLRIEIAGKLSEASYESDGNKYLNDLLSENKKLSEFDTGRIYYYMKDYENAKVHLEKARDDGDADTILFLGKTYEKLGDFNYATSVYQNYLNKHQDSAFIYNQLGLCKINAKDAQGARDAFKTAQGIENNGMNQALEFNEIVANEYLGDFKQASVLMTAYCKKYPDDQDALRENIFLKTR